MRRLVLMSLLVAVSACGGAEATSPPTTAPSPTTTQTEATTTTTAPPTTTTTEAATATTIRGFGSSTFAVPFTFDGPAVGLELDESLDAQGVLFTAGDNRWIIFSATGPMTIEEWSERLSRKGTVTDPVEAVVGGVSATSIDASLEGLVSVFSPDVTPVWDFVAEAGDRLRLYLLDVEGVTVKVFVLASAEDFDGWMPEVEPVLEALVWG